MSLISHGNAIEALGWQGTLTGFTKSVLFEASRVISPRARHGWLECAPVLDIRSLS
jgi:hypothetical protein